MEWTDVLISAIVALISAIADLRGAFSLLFQGFFEVEIPVYGLPEVLQVSALP